MVSSNENWGFKELLQHLCWYTNWRFSLIFLKEVDFSRNQAVMSGEHQKESHHTTQFWCDPGKFSKSSLWVQGVSEPRLSSITIRWPVVFNSPNILNIIQGYSYYQFHRKNSLRNKFWSFRKRRNSNHDNHPQTWYWRHLRKVS